MTMSAFGVEDSRLAKADHGRVAESATGAALVGGGAVALRRGARRARQSQRHYENATDLHFSAGMSAGYEPAQHVDWLRATGHPDPVGTGTRAQARRRADAAEKSRMASEFEDAGRAFARRAGHLKTLGGAAVATGGLLGAHAVLRNRASARPS